MVSFMATMIVSTLISCLCFTIFLGQAYYIFEEYIHPPEASTSMHHEDLNKTDFPVIIKVCLKEGFNMTRLKNNGYSSEFDYFTGRKYIKDSTPSSEGWRVIVSFIF